MSTEVVVAFAAVAQIIVTGILALVVHRSTAKFARLDYTRSVREAWVAVDELALANDATLQAADTLLEPKPGESLEFARKRWFILAYLNPITTAWQGAHDGIFGSRKDDHLAGIKTQLKALLKDDDAYWVTQHHGHEEAFQKLCTEIWLANQTPGSRSKTPPAKAPPK